MKLWEEKNAAPTAPGEAAPPAEAPQLGWNNTHVDWRRRGAGLIVGTCRDCLAEAASDDPCFVLRHCGVVERPPLNIIDEFCEKTGRKYPEGLRKLPRVIPAYEDAQAQWFDTQRKEKETANYQEALRKLAEKVGSVAQVKIRVRMPGKPATEYRDQWMERGRAMTEVLSGAAKIFLPKQNSRDEAKQVERKAAEQRDYLACLRELAQKPGRYFFVLDKRSGKEQMLPRDLAIKSVANGLAEFLSTDADRKVQP